MGRSSGIDPSEPESLPARPIPGWFSAMMRRPVFLVLLVFIGLNLPFLTAYPAIDRTGDESWFMNYSLELIESGKLRGTMFPLAGDLNEGNMLNPWLYSGTLSLFFLVFGPAIWSGRLLSLLCSVGTVYLTYRTGRELFSEKVAVTGSLFLGTSIFFASSAREIRPEAMFTLLFVLGCYFFYRAVRSDRNSSRHLLLFLSSFTVSSLIEVHPNGFLAMFSLFVLYFIFFSPRFSRHLLSFSAGFAAVLALWFVVNFLPFMDRAFSSFQTIHYTELPPILRGDFLSPLKGLLFLPEEFAVYLFDNFYSHYNYQNMTGISFFGVLGTAVFAAYLIFSRIRLRAVALLLVTLLVLLSSHVFRGDCLFVYFTYFIPFSALIAAACISGLSEKYHDRKAVQWITTGIVLVTCLVSAVDSVEADMRFVGYKHRYDSVMKTVSDTIPPDSVVMGSGMYYQAFRGSRKYYSFLFMYMRCPSFERSMSVLDVDYIIMDDTFRDRAEYWCTAPYYAGQIEPFLNTQCDLVKKMRFGYPTRNSDGVLNEVSIFRVRKEKR
jgi:4-amino-4-deoxy-L-arabinose transferase-like glycosyltransferase